MYSYGPPHKAEQKQDDQHEHTFSNYMRIRDLVQKTCQRGWTIGKNGERGSGISVLPARHDDDHEDSSLNNLQWLLCHKTKPNLCWSICVNNFKNLLYYIVGYFMLAMNLTFSSHYHINQINIIELMKHYWSLVYWLCTWILLNFYFFSNSTHWHVI